MWTTGNLNGYEYQIKHYSEGSVFGIDEGKISKLHISRDGKTVVNYDRGWDIEPVDSEARAVYEALLLAYN